MGYATNADITPYIVSQTITSKVSTAQMDAWCNQYSARVDAILTRNGYSTVPATGANDLLLLKGMVSLGVAALTWRVAFGSDPPFVVAWDQAWTSFLDALTRGDIRLEDQSPAASITVAVPKVYGVD